MAKKRRSPGIVARLVEPSDGKGWALWIYDDRSLRRFRKWEELQLEQLGDGFHVNPGKDSPDRPTDPRFYLVELDGTEPLSVTAYCPHCGTVALSTDVARYRSTPS